MFLIRTFGQGGMNKIHVKTVAYAALFRHTA